MTARAASAALLLAAAGCATAPLLAPAPGSTSRAPYDLPPASQSRITITLDLRAARQILAVLSKERFDPAEAKLLEFLPAVRLAIQDSNRPPETFERDLAATFDEQSRIAVFDFRRVREERAHWDSLLSTLASREDELTRQASNRAAALLPAEPPVSVTAPIALTFGLPGRADHILAPADGTETMTVFDLARALSDDEASSPSVQIEHLSRLVAGEAYQRAWTAYRASSPAWQKHDPELKQLEPLLRETAEAGPVALYAVDQNFFPLSVWLKDRMRVSLDELNRVADRIMSTEGDLDQRVSLSAEVRRPDFVSRVAAPAGSFLADGIIQSLGVDAYRAALAAGPRAFFEAYERASKQKGRQLIPLAKVIRERLTPSPASPKAS